MKLIYTDNFTLDTDGVLIQRGATSGNGTIPNNLLITSIVIELVTSTDVIDVKGTYEDSSWITQRTGSGYSLERIQNDDRLFMAVRANSGTVEVNLHCEGSDK